MAPNRPKSPKERRDAKNARSFIGRTEQQDQFTRSLVQPDHVDAKLIFSISGQGGVGKTSLLREFRQIAEKAGHVVAYVDEGVATNRVDDVPEAMHRLAEDLERQNFKFDKFRERYKAYRVKKQEMEADPEAPKGFVGDATRGLVKVALDVGKSSVPVVGGMLDSEMLASKAGELMNYGVERFRGKDEERLIKETLEVLTPLFLEGVKRIPVEKTLVLMLDTYEVTGAFLDEWVRGLLDEDYGKLERSILLCIGGREPIDRNAWDEWESMIARSPLEPFTRAEAEAFLVGKQIKSAAVIEEIWRLSSGGLPLLVSMMAAPAPTSADAVVDPCVDAVNRFLVWETDGGRRDLAQDAACARVLNADVVAALGEGSFEWLSGCAFVLRDGARWRYHLVVREQMLRYLEQKSPKRYGEVHGKLAAYYNGLRNGLGLEAGKEAEDETWREHSLEWIYHELCAAPQAKLGLALNGFLGALKQSRNFAKSWAASMLQAGQESKCETLQKWGDRLRNGMESATQKRYEEVVVCLTTLLAEKLISEKLKSVAFDQRGYAYRQLGDQKLSLQDMLKAVELNAEDATYQFGLALTHQNLGDYDAAITQYQRAIKLNPEYASAYNNLGSVYSAQKRYEEAITQYKCAIELNPKSANTCNNLAITYNVQKRYEEAIAQYQCAIKLNPKNALTYNSLGSVYLGQKRYEEAITAYQRAILLSPEYASAYNNLGITYYDQKSYEEAITAYQRAILLSPEYAYAYNNLGNTYKAQKRYEEAIAAYQRSIELDPLYANAFGGLGITYAAQKCYEKAIIQYQRTIELNPEDAIAYNNLGVTYKNQKLYEKAITQYERAIKLNPNLKQALVNRGQIYRLMRRYEDALKQFDHLIELDSEYRSAIRNRGEVYLEIGQTEKAVEDFSRAIEPDAEAKWAYYLRAIAYLKLNQPEPAENDFQKAISTSTSKYEKDPIDWCNTFNLALYHLAAAHPEESDRLYTSNLAAPIEWLQMAIDDLDDFLHLCPDHSQAQQAKQLLQGAIDAAQPTTL
jgi:tetratricopeptide (TPR) repeat protein